MIEGVMEEGAEERLGDPVTDMILIDWDGIVEQYNASRTPLLVMTLMFVMSFIHEPFMSGTRIRSKYQQQTLFHQLLEDISFNSKARIRYCKPNQVNCKSPMKPHFWP